MLAVTTYRYESQDGRHDITEEEILRTYYPYWQEQMRKVGKEALISPEACIEDFIVVHWAWKVCKDYKPDHNGECLNCDEPADAHEIKP